MSPKDYSKKLGQVKMTEFITQKGGKFARYPEE